MKIAVISANLGGYDPHHEWTPQVVPGATVWIHRFSDLNFPPRPKAMTPALQVGLLKWFGHEFVPPADVYFWVDASCALLRPQAVWWFLERLGAAELLLFNHPDRSSVRAEYEFIKARLARPGEKYLTTRYRWEWLDELYARIAGDPTFVDDRLFASTAFMYRPTECVKALLKEVWYGKTRWHLHDQLWLAYAVARSGCAVNVLPEKYTECPFLAYVRNKPKASAA